MLTEISRTLAGVYYTLKKFHASKTKTSNLSVKIEKNHQIISSNSQIFCSDTSLSTTVVIALLAKLNVAKKQNSLVTIGELQLQKLHAKTMTNVQILIPIQLKILLRMVWWLQFQLTNRIMCIAFKNGQQVQKQLNRDFLIVGLALLIVIQKL